MIAKKNKKANLERKRFAFFQIGLLVAGSLVLAAFEYSTVAVDGKQVTYLDAETPTFDPNDVQLDDFKIPEEIAVIGFRNSLCSTIVEPQLTTIDQPGKRIGKIAVDCLIEEIEKPHHNLSDSTAKEVVDKALERIRSDSSVKTIITITKAKNGGYKILERYTNIRENY